MTQIPDKKFVSWQEVEKAIQTLKMILEEHKKLKGIIALARGGMVPAVMLAHALNIAIVSSISIQSYCGKTKLRRSRFFGDLPKQVLDSQGEGWLIVDDICDTGNALQKIKQLIPQALSLCLFYKPGAKISPDFWYFTAPSNHWIVFPWENQEE